MCVFALLGRFRRRRENEAGYTTVFKNRGYPRVDQRSGLVLYAADAPDPEWDEWRAMRRMARDIRRRASR